MSDTVLISKKQYERLLEDSHFLRCLELAGVDNWCGYGDAIDMCFGDDDDDDED